ncbi:hypothetical protein HK102_005659 [Quaeritorhiza haematococci]|nr:hypothetical protein HK102_005659 [Quaeritorhiza haematococci]
MFGKRSRTFLLLAVGTGLVLHSSGVFVEAQKSWLKPWTWSQPMPQPPQPEVRHVHYEQPRHQQPVQVQSQKSLLKPWTWFRSSQPQLPEQPVSGVWKQGRAPGEMGMTEAVQEQMSPIFQYMNELMMPDILRTGLRPSLFGKGYILRSSDRAYDAFIDLPGIYRNELTVHVVGRDLIHVFGKHECAKTSDNTTQVDPSCIEREYDTKLSIPSDVNADDVDVVLSHGVLRVHMPRIREVKGSQGRGRLLSIREGLYDAMRTAGETLRHPFGGGRRSHEEEYEYPGDYAREAWRRAGEGARGAYEGARGAGEYGREEMYEGMRRTGEGVREGARGVYEGARGAGEYAADTARRGAEGVYQGARGAGEYVADTARGAAQGVRGAGEYVADTARRGAESVYEGARGAGEYVADTARGAAQGVYEGARGAAEGVYRGAAKAGEVAGDTAKGAAGAGLGMGEYVSEKVRDTLRAAREGIVGQGGEGRQGEGRQVYMEERERVQEIPVHPGKMQGEL